MLIHLKGTVENDIIEFDLPQIYFKRGQNTWVRGLNGGIVCFCSLCSFGDVQKSTFKCFHRN